MAYTAEMRATKKAEEDAKTLKKLEAKIRKEIEAELKSKESVLTTENNKPETKSSTKKKIPLDTLIPCRSGVQGELVYLSKRINGYRIEWEEYDSIEYVELSELLSMRNTNKSFYVNNWLFFEDTDEYLATEIYSFLEVSKFYENAIVGEELDEIFIKSPEELTKIVSKLSAGVKNTIAAKARKLIDSKELDSNNKIEALEKALNVELNPSY